MNFTQQSTYSKLKDGIAWRLRKLLGDRSADFPKIAAARIWRRFLIKPVFIGITGSAGKTTAKEMLVSLLSTKGRTIGNPGSLNVVAEVARLILQMRPSHNYCVTEMGAPKPTSLDDPLALFKPSIGIITVIGDDHLIKYDSREAIAHEKAKVVTSLPASGTAILNADDPLVLAMKPNCSAKVLTYGTSPGADLRATNISANWPERLTFTATLGNQQAKVESQFCGSFLATPMLSAMAGGIATGMSLNECATALAKIAPFEGRMQPVEHGGVTFIRDDFKAPLWSMDLSLEFMKNAQAKRKILVIGTLCELGSKKSSQIYARLARRACEIADIAIFAGPWAFNALKARRPGEEDKLLAFSHVRDAANFINSITTAGDLVLLKGTNTLDHLVRILMARTNDIACWRDDCKRVAFCQVCPDRGKLVGPTAMSVETPAPPATLLAVPTPASEPDLAYEKAFIVGLGNPGAEFAGTPHNVGYEAVDSIAYSLGLTWEKNADAWVAHGTSNRRPFCLVKMHTQMNHTGGALKQLAESLLFEVRQCVLLFDDLDVPIGSLRTRLNGGAAGHKGLASILDAFQTNEFRRVKIGVGHPHAKLNRVEYVLKPFDAAMRPSVAEGVQAAGVRALEMATGGGTFGTPGAPKPKKAKAPKEPSPMDSP